MKRLIYAIILLGVFSQNTYAQADSVAWQYDFLGDTVTIAKTGAKIVGADTLSVYHVFHEATITDSLFLKEGGDTTFLYYDSAFYFLYANQAEVGDIWRPIRYVDFVPSLPGYKDTCESLYLEVIDKDSILVNGDWLNTFLLHDAFGYVLGTGGNVSVVEKIGCLEIEGLWSSFVGFLYNYLYNSCGQIADAASPCFISYYSQELNFMYDSIAPSCYQTGGGIEENASRNEPKIIRKDNRIEVTWNNESVNLELYSLSGQKLISASENSLYLPETHGLYFLHIQQGQELRIVKWMN